MQIDTILVIMVSEAIKTSEIEGEILSRIDVKSSVRNNVGLTLGLPVRDKRAQGIGRPVLLSLSKAIESNRKAYYAELEKAQHSLEITSWIKYFIDTILAAQKDSENEIE